MDDTADMALFRPLRDSCRILSTFGSPIEVSGEEEETSGVRWKGFVKLLPLLTALLVHLAYGAIGSAITSAAGIDILAYVRLSMK